MSHQRNVLNQMGSVAVEHGEALHELLEGTSRPESAPEKTELDQGGVVRLHLKEKRLVVSRVRGGHRGEPRESTLQAC